MSEKAPGFEEYTPSRLEWLVVMLNSYSSYLNLSDINHTYIPGGDGKTLRLHISYDKNTPKERVDSFVESIKSFASSIIKNLRWDSWVKIETKFFPME